MIDEEWRLTISYIIVAFLLNLYAESGRHCCAMRLSESFVFKACFTAFPAFHVSTVFAASRDTRRRVICRLFVLNPGVARTANALPTLGAKTGSTQ